MELSKSLCIYFILIFSLNTQAQTESTLTPAAQNSCRAEAKEVAAKAYRSCIVESHKAQIEQIKKYYQDQIKALKAKNKADDEIKEMKIELKPTVDTVGATDDSVMDLPEPIPVDL